MVRGGKAVCPDRSNACLRSENWRWVFQEGESGLASFHHSSKGQRASASGRNVIERARSSDAGEQPSNRQRSLLQPVKTKAQDGADDSRSRFLESGEPFVSALAAVGLVQEITV